jgi:serine/threonine-protein kinase RsbT
MGPKADTEILVPIQSSADIVTARQRGRELAQQIGFSGSDLTVISTAVSEIARNIVEHAKVGEVMFQTVREGSRAGLTIIARDNGPGIENISLAMQDAYSTGKGLGLGLPGSKRLMDEFEIVSVLGRGTTVTMRKWKR